MSTDHSKNPYRGYIYTLAQTGTEPGGKRAIMLTGTGSDATNLKALKGRAKRKLITQKMMLGLIDVLDQKNEMIVNGMSEKRKKSFWNTYHCQNKIYTANGKLYGRYCKNRFCTLCCSIRKAAIINSYLPFVQTWKEPYFVTLTVRSVPLYKLKAVIRSVLKGINNIIAKYKKRNQRGKGIKLMGVRSLECNFNARKKTYNPHFHLIVPNREIAKIIINEWLTTSNPGWNLPVAQKMSKIMDNQKALIEVVKYGSKIFTDPDLKKKEKSKGNESIYMAALNNILEAMKGIRIFERFGFNLSQDRNIQPPGALVVKDYKEWEYDINIYDWATTDGNRLTTFQPNAKLLELINEKVNTDLE